MARLDPNGRVGRAVQRVARTRGFAKVMPPIITPLDRAVSRVTKGKVMLSKMLVPSLVLTTTGAKSGQPRTVPLATIPLDGGWYVVGSNFGRERHPAWSANLLAHPDARITFDGEDIAVHAQLLSDEEKAEVWPRLTGIWPAYDSYVERSGRNIRVFHLTKT